MEFDYSNQTPHPRSYGSCATHTIKSAPTPPFDPTMEKLESLQAFVQEFRIKRSTTAIFGISELIHQARAYVEVCERPTHLNTGYLPDIVFEDDSANQFCSIFSEADQTSATQFTETEELLVLRKLHSDSEILSSEFEIDAEVPILTSECR